MNNLLRTISTFLLATALLACTRDTKSATPATPAAVPAAPAWIATSNQHTAQVIDALARFAPEQASALGAEGYDDQIRDLTPGHLERMRDALRQVIDGLQQQIATETEPPIRQDLQILIDFADRMQRGMELEATLQLPYYNVPQFVFEGLRSLLDDQVAPARRQAALVRLRKYTGMEPGTTPLTQLAMDRTRERLDQPGLLGPMADEVTRDLDSISFFLTGLAQLFEKYQIAGYQEPMARLTEQLGAYEAFVRAEILPRARTDFRLPPALYAFQLELFGIDIPPGELAALGRQGFQEIQAEMQTIAAQVARQRGWQDMDYRAVIANLKKEQLVGEAILPHYQERLAQIEDIIRREKLVSLPGRPVRVRLATEAESAQQPAPHMRPPRLLNNDGEQGEFVLPLGIPGKDPDMAKQYDDFTFAAASWTLTAHEARPGHELQFASMVERGVSLARALFSFNSVNIEGWALYAEYLVEPHMPLEGQLISLQERLLRAARAFCDPELQMGKMTPAQVKELLMNEVVQSDAMATQEVERYTFRAPGQAGSYFYGYTRLLALRAETEAALGASFDQQAYHDFLLAQGVLPHAVLRNAVMEDLVGAR